MRNMILGLLCCCLMSATIGCTTVSTGYVGVRKVWGAAEAKPIKPGLHFFNPFSTSIVQLDTRLRSYQVYAESSSHDLQKVHTQISVQHSLNGNMATEAYTVLGDLDSFDQNVIAPAVMESLKAVCAQYTAEELITKRDQVKKQTCDAIQAFIDHTLKDKEIEGSVHVTNMAINDFDFSTDFNQSIKEKVKVEQKALQAENEKKRKITDAEAKAKEAELAADAEAYSMEQLSKQRAAAIEREAKALAANPGLLQLRAVEKWDGVLPRITGGGVVPFLPIDMQEKAKAEIGSTKVQVSEKVAQAD